MLGVVVDGVLERKSNDSALAQVLLQFTSGENRSSLFICYLAMPSSLVDEFHLLLIRDLLVALLVAEVARLPLAALAIDDHVLQGWLAVPFLDSDNCSHCTLIMHTSEWFGKL